MLQSMAETFQYKCRYWQISHYPKIDREQTWKSINFCKIIKNVVINGSDVIDTSDKVWIVQNGKYLTYPKIDR